MLNETIDKKPFLINISVLISAAIGLVVITMWTTQWKYDHESRIIYLEQQCEKQQDINKEIDDKSDNIQVQLADIRGDMKVVKQMIAQLVKASEK